MNSNIEYTPSFIGHVAKNDITYDFVTDVRKVLKGTGFSIWLRGRHPNRKQFYPEKDRTVTYKDGTTHTHKSSYQQDLPREHASYFAMYLRGDGDGDVKGMVNVVRTLAKKHHVLL